ncbi:hypothetical protein ACWDOP_33525, partial [Nocardia sp. NPDC003693]
MNSREVPTIATSAKALAAAVENLLELPMYSMPDGEVIEVMQELETTFRKLEAVKQRFALECGARGLSSAAGVKSLIL